MKRLGNRIGAALLMSLGAWGSLGCELITKVDRSKIELSNGGQGGQGGEGGNMPPAVVCGDGKIATSEACDDGNTTAGDGCDAARA